MGKAIGQSWASICETITELDALDDEDSLFDFNCEDSPMEVLKKDVVAGETIILGGNHAGGDTGAQSNYFCVIQPLLEIVKVSTKKEYSMTRALIGARHTSIAFLPSQI